MSTTPTPRRGDRASTPAALPGGATQGRLEWRQLLDWLQADGWIGSADVERVARRLGAGTSTLHALVRLGGADLERRLPDGSTRPLDVEALTEWVAGRARLPYLRIDPLKADVGRVSEVMPVQYAESRRALPVKVSPTEVTLATAEPFDLSWVAELENHLRRPVRLVVSSPDDVRRFAEALFGGELLQPAMLDQMAKGDMPNEQQLRTIAAASLDEQKEVWKAHKPKKGDPQVSWWSVAQGLQKTRMYARDASFGDDLREAYGIEWADDLFGPADQDNRFTTNVEAFLGAQQEWMTSNLPKKGASVVRAENRSTGAARGSFRKTSIMLGQLPMISPNRLSLSSPWSFALSARSAFRSIAFCRMRDACEAKIARSSSCVRSKRCFTLSLPT